MKTIGKILLVLIVVVLGLICWDHWRASSFTTRAQSIAVGDSKQKVRSVLGEPTTVFLPIPQTQTNFVALLFSVRSETWAYGSRLDLKNSIQREFPYFYPLRLRLFHPDSDDVEIVFDSSGKVQRVFLPDKATSK